MRLLSALLSLLIAACTTPSIGRALVVLARDEDGHPLAGLSVELDGIPAARTGAEGRVHISLGGDGPPRVRIAVVCPEGSRESNPRHIARHLDGATARLELRFVCRPAQRVLAVVVRAEGFAGSVLRVDGEPVGTVAADGTLHAIVRRTPDSELQLMLDTGTLAVRPRNPLREHRVGDRDELLVFDQLLQVPATKVSSPRRPGKIVGPTGGFGGRR